VADFASDFLAAVLALLLLFPDLLPSDLDRATVAQLRYRQAAKASTAWLQ
jgi:hypothetical protein